MEPKPWIYDQAVGVLSGPPESWQEQKRGKRLTHCCKVWSDCHVAFISDGRHIVPAFFAPEARQKLLEKNAGKGLTILENSKVKLEKYHWSTVNLISAEKRENQVFLRGPLCLHVLEVSPMGGKGTVLRGNTPVVNEEATVKQLKNKLTVLELYEQLKSSQGLQDFIAADGGRGSLSRTLDDMKRDLEAKWAAAKESVETATDSLAALRGLTQNEETQEGANTQNWEESVGNDFGSGQQMQLLTPAESSDTGETQEKDAEKGDEGGSYRRVNGAGAEDPVNEEDNMDDGHYSQGGKEYEGGDYSQEEEGDYNDYEGGAHGDGPLTQAPDTGPFTQMPDPMSPAASLTPLEQQPSPPSRSQSPVDYSQRDNRNMTLTGGSQQVVYSGTTASTARSQESVHSLGLPLGQASPPMQQPTPRRSTKKSGAKNLSPYASSSDSDSSLAAPFSPSSRSRKRGRSASTPRQVPVKRIVEESSEDESYSDVYPRYLTKKKEPAPKSPLQKSKAKAKSAPPAKAARRQESDDSSDDEEDLMKALFKTKRKDKDAKSVGAAHTEKGKAKAKVAETTTKKRPRERR